MDALQLNSSDKTLTFSRVEKPTIAKDDDVIVRVAYGGVCGTDLHMISGHFPGKSSPVTLGHEIAGIVAEVGKAVTNVQVGTRVAVDPCSACHCCRYCARGAFNLCIHGALADMIGRYRDGGWAPYCKVPAEYVHALPENIPLQQGVLCEPLSCVNNAMGRLGHISLDSEILILGAGIIGLLFASVFHARGHRRVIISEVAGDRRKIAQGTGLGFQVFTPSDLAAKYQHVNVDEAGLDVVVDCAGDPPAVNDAVRWLRGHGKLCLFAIYSPEDLISLSPYEAVLKELTIVTSITAAHTFSTTVEMTASMWDKYLSYEQLGIEVFSLDDHQTALKSLESKRISKAVFRVSGVN